MKLKTNRFSHFIESGKTILVAIVGAGAMGKGLFRQSSITKGLRCAALIDIQIEKAIACAVELGCKYRRVDSAKSMSQAIREGFLAICEDGSIAAECEEIEVLIEASSSIGAAGRVCETALKRGQHVVMMNSEADLIFGPYLMELSDVNQVVYTSSDGDQHGVLSRLIQDCNFWGFELILAGNIKGYLDRYSNPTAIIAEADKRNLDYKMATAYTDGTKLSIEMSLLANAYNLTVDTPGMHGPIALDVEESLHLFDLERNWESKQPTVDYILGAKPGGGVFVIGRSEDAYQQSMMNYYKMGKGPFYLFYRPYHLCHVESMLSIFEAVYEKQSLLQPVYGFRTNVYSYAKKDLLKGTILDGVGGYCCYGIIENESNSQNLPGLPICLSDGLKLLRDVKANEKINLRDVFIDSTRDDIQLFEKAIHSSSKLSQILLTRHANK